MSEHVGDVRFDHTIIPAADKRRAATFFTEIFGLPAPVEAGYFMQVRLSDGRIFDFAETGTAFPGQHLAFLVADETFDAIIDRVRHRGIEHWADPQQRRPGEINHHHGGRGVYFLDPDGRYLEAITTRYDGTDLT